MRHVQGHGSLGGSRRAVVSVLLIAGLATLAGDARAQLRRPGRPGRPGMNRGTPRNNNARPGNNGANATPPSNANPAGNPAAAGPDAAGAAGASAPVTNLADPSAPAPELWKVKPDPPEQKPAEIAPDVLLRVPPSFFGGDVTFPTAPSSFVAVGRNGDQNDIREVWDLAAKKRIGGVRGAVKLEKPLALSPDGSLLAGRSDQVVAVYDTKTGRMVAQLQGEGHSVKYVDFAGPGRVVTGDPGDRRFEVWDLKSQKSDLDIGPRDRVEEHAVTISPGRRYLAMICKDTLLVYDLESGRKAGEAKVPKQKNFFELGCKGLAFSPDGSELAGVFDSFGTHLLCWDVATGRLTQHFLYDDKSNVKAALGSEVGAIQWLADRAGWLVFGSVVIDHRSGQRIFTIPSDTPNADKHERRIVGKNIVMITFGDGQNRKVGGYPLPTETLAKASKLIEQGGSAADAALPELTSADLSGAKHISGAGGAWSVRPAASAAPRPVQRRIPTQVQAAEAAGMLFSAIEGHQLALVSIAGGGNPFDPNKDEGKPRRLIRFDITSGRVLGRIELSPFVDPIALSPDGSRVLTLDKDRRRVDVFATSDAGHVAGFRPYEKEPSDNDKGVTFAAFVEADKVLTASRGGKVVLWSLPACKAVYVADNACEGAPALNPGRSLLACYQGGRFHLLDAATGETRGVTQPAQASAGRSELKGAAFQADGAGLVALLGGQQVVRWELSTGKVTADFPISMTISPMPGSHHSAIESCGPDNVLLDGRILIALDKQSHIWSYFGPNVSAGGPDGQHWFVQGAMNQNATISSLVLPEATANRVVAMVGDPSVHAALRVGMTVSPVLELSGPPDRNAEFKKELADGLSAKLQANAMTVGSGGLPSIVVHVEEHNTGKSVDYRNFGDSHFGQPRGSIAVTELVCDVSFADAQGRIPLAPQQRISLLQGFRMMYRIGPNETLESHLKNGQWAGVKNFVSGIGLPYFVARQAGGVAMLPGTTDLNAIR
ncbi:hypothetical protein OJF2_58510 [Aquisphaera giovannonii]|uniref:Uncharacterized protein n=1 Tax=Aquisphaera giovannonii TaxID=406548 RepID=A0A5B9WAH7_9BACT|nr:hypothetical protein [Aquisphaera giovannonii]QEH37264.1 hypothetical protein OJF2_58510 [Aquisphaera giovannonii]